jgi:L-alanine-DL-glutamate epimerase-like enolase superfamily enzyme
MTRGARAERQANLRLLESARLETDEKRKQLEAQLAAMPVLLAEQSEEVLNRVLARSADALVEFFQHHRLRVAEKHWHGMPRNTQHGDDLEMVAAVEAVNLALYAYDRASLDLRIGELFGGRLPWKEERGLSRRSLTAAVRLDVFRVCVHLAKQSGFDAARKGEDLRGVERESFQESLQTLITVREKRDSEEKSQDLDRERGTIHDAPAIVPT